MKKSIFKRIAVVTAIVAIVAFAIDLAIGFASGTLQSIYRGDFDFRERSGDGFPVDETRCVPVAGIEGILISSTGETIKVHEVPGSSITLRWHGRLCSMMPTNRPTLQVRQQGSMVKISIDWQNVTWVGAKYNDTVLEIGVPKAYAGRLSADSVSGNIRLDGHSYTGLALKTVSGEIQGKTAARELSAESTSGNVSLDLARVPESTKARTVSGEIRLGLPKDAGFALDAGSVSGNVNCDFPINLDTRSGGSRITGRVASETNVIHAESVSGKISILRSEGPHE